MITYVHSVDQVIKADRVVTSSERQVADATLPIIICPCGPVHVTGRIDLGTRELHSMYMHYILYTLTLQVLQLAPNFQPTPYITILHPKCLLELNTAVMPWFHYYFYDLAVDLLFPRDKTSRVLLDSRK
jgi:hypothetical protein